jgi:hypothetical protein
MHSGIDAHLLALLRSTGRHGSGPPLCAAEWDALAGQAVRLGVAPLVHARLAQSGADWPVPELVRQSLKARYVRAGLENLRLLARLAALLPQLREAGIEVIVLKGAYLAQSVYGDPALRPMGDADLLVRQADLDRAAALLRADGWRERAAHESTVPGGGGHQLPMFERGGVHLELHWAIEDDASPFSIDGEGLWQRAVPARINGAPTWALSPEDLLLHLCVHAAYGHGWRQFDTGLRPLCDIAACLRRFGDRIDWGVLADRARAWHIHPSVELTLVLVRDLLGAAVPPWVLDRLAPPRIERAVVDAATALVLAQHYGDLARHLPVLGRSWLTKRWHRLPAGARWRAHALPSGEALARVYPSLDARMLRPLRYAAHWADLLNDVARVSFGRRGRSLVAQERRRMTVLRWLESV